MRHAARNSCAACPQRDGGIFAAVGEDALARIVEHRTVQTFRSGRELFCEAGPALAVYCLLEGRVRLSMAGEGGEEFVLEFCGPGRLLGLRALLAGDPHEATAVAVGDVRACTIPREAMEEVFHHAPAALRAAARAVALELRGTHLRLVEAVQHTVPRRVAHMLIELEERSPAALHTRRADLAHMVGTTPETLSRVLHALESRGAVEVTRTEIRIRDAALLRRIARLPEHDL